MTNGPQLSNLARERRDAELSGLRAVVRQRGSRRVIVSRAAGVALIVLCAVGAVITMKAVRSTPPMPIQPPIASVIPTPVPYNATTTVADANVAHRSSIVVIRTDANIMDRLALRGQVAPMIADDAMLRMALTENGVDPGLVQVGGVVYAPGLFKVP